MANYKEVANLMLDAFEQYLIDREVAECGTVTDDTPVKPDDFDVPQYDENGRPLFLLCDEIWEILDDAGHGTPVIIHRENKAPEVLIYNRYASQSDNVRFMGRISEAIDAGNTVTINGTNILDLY